MQTVIETVATVRVGRSGTKTHRLPVSVRGNSHRTGEPYVLAGSTYCGSQRIGSGWSALPVGTLITCEKCLVAQARDSLRPVVSMVGDIRYIFQPDPLRVLVNPRGAWGSIGITDEAIAIVKGERENFA
jgi:hypothetical protein